MFFVILMFFGGLRGPSLGHNFDFDSNLAFGRNHSGADLCGNLECSIAFWSKGHLFGSLWGALAPKRVPFGPQFGSKSQPFWSCLKNFGANAGVSSTLIYMFLFIYCRVCFFFSFVSGCQFQLALGDFPNTIVSQCQKNVSNFSGTFFPPSTCSIRFF